MSDEGDLLGSEEESDSEVDMGAINSSDSEEELIDEKKKQDKKPKKAAAVEK